MSKQPKTTVPTDADLRGNPLIGGTKGTRAAGETPDALAADLGEATLEGDRPSDTNRHGGIDKAEARGAPARR